MESIYLHEFKGLLQQSSYRSYRDFVKNRNQKTAWLSTSELLDHPIEFQAGLLIEFFRQNGIFISINFADDDPNFSTWAWIEDSDQVFVHDTNGWRAFADACLVAFDRLEQMNGALVQAAPPPVQMFRAPKNIVAGMAAVLLFTGCGFWPKMPDKFPVTLPPLPTSDSVFVRIDTLRQTDTLEWSGETVVYLDTTICPPSDSAREIIRTVERPARVIVRTVTVRRDSVVFRCDEATVARAVEAGFSVKKALKAVALFLMAVIGIAFLDAYFFGRGLGKKSKNHESRPLIITDHNIDCERFHDDPRVVLKSEIFGIPEGTLGRVDRWINFESEGMGAALVLWDTEVSDATEMLIPFRNLAHFE